MVETLLYSACVAWVGIAFAFVVSAVWLTIKAKNRRLTVAQVFYFWVFQVTFIAYVGCFTYALSRVSAVMDVCHPL